VRFFSRLSIEEGLEEIKNKPHMKMCGLFYAVLTRMHGMAGKMNF
jgi:hypothetical protein